MTKLPFDMDEYIENENPIALLLLPDLIDLWAAKPINIAKSV
jgi:hypothetical protein